MSSLHINPISVYFLLFLVLLNELQSIAISTKSQLLSLSRNAPISEVRSLVSQLEQQSSSSLQFPDLWSKLEGKWRLIYTNNARTFSDPIGGSSGQSQLLTVQQNIFLDSVDHVLTFDKQPNLQVILKHKVKVSSYSNPAQLAIDLYRIDFEYNNANNDKKYKISTPSFPGPNLFRRGFFDVSCLCFIVLCFSYTTLTTYIYMYIICIYRQPISMRI